MRFLLSVDTWKNIDNLFLLLRASTLNASIWNLVPCPLAVALSLL